MTDEKTHILVVDDDPAIRSILEMALTNGGFRVSQAAGGTAMREIMARDPAGLVVLDVLLPGEDGFSLTRFLRANYRCGIIMLTGNDDPTDAVVGLEIGADDYIVKPCRHRDLIARIRSVLRRMGELAAAGPAPINGAAMAVMAGQEVMAFGRWRFDLGARHLTDIDGTIVSLTSGEFNLLNEFVTKPGRVLTREHLLNAVHNRDWDHFDRSIDVLVTRLRQKLEVDSSRPALIKTVRGAGYVFTGPVTRPV